MSLSNLQQDIRKLETKVRQITTIDVDPNETMSKDMQMRKNAQSSYASWTTLFFLHNK